MRYYEKQGIFSISNTDFYNLCKCYFMTARVAEDVDPYKTREGEPLPYERIILFYP